MKLEETPVYRNVPRNMKRKSLVSEDAEYSGKWGRHFPKAIILLYIFLSIFANLTIIYMSYTQKYDKHTHIKTHISTFIFFIM